MYALQDVQKLLASHLGIRVGYIPHAVRCVAVSDNLVHAMLAYGYAMLHSMVMFSTAAVTL